MSSSTRARRRWRSRSGRRQGRAARTPRALARGRRPRWRDGKLEKVADATIARPLAHALRRRPLLGACRRAICGPTRSSASSATPWRWRARSPKDPHRKLPDPALYAGPLRGRPRAPRPEDLPSSPADAAHRAARRPWKRARGRRRARSGISAVTASSVGLGEYARHASPRTASRARTGRPTPRRRPRSA